ncbi:hypothetical protein KEM56_004637, partial [Ascosphaera pollenicola]
QECPQEASNRSPAPSRRLPRSPWRRSSKTNGKLVRYVGMIPTNGHNQEETKAPQDPRKGELESQLAAAQEALALALEQVKSDGYAGALGSAIKKNNLAAFESLRKVDHLRKSLRLAYKIDEELKKLQRTDNNDDE